MKRAGESSEESVCQIPRGVSRSRRATNRFFNPRDGELTLELSTVALKRDVERMGP